MPDDQLTALPHPYFEVKTDAVPRRTGIDFSVNHYDSEIVALAVNGITITTVRENWSAIYVLLSRIVGRYTVIFDDITHEARIETTA